MIPEVPSPQQTVTAPRTPQSALLAAQRCFHHGHREAVARCPECRNFFCRECITEHEHRVICAACLKRIARTPLTRRPVFVGFLRTVQVAFGLFVSLAFFYWLGQTLLELPDSFHDGTVWRGRWLDEDSTP